MIPSMPFRFLHPSPLGQLAVTLSDGCITACHWCREEEELSGLTEEGDGASAEYAMLANRVHQQLDEYFSHRRTGFSLPLILTGTAFHKRVWDTLCHIPYGTMLSYGALAARVGNPRAARAVAQACHRNPIAIIVPCHRIVGSDGSLTGYAAGVERKRWLLELEGAFPPALCR